MKHRIIHLLDWIDSKILGHRIYWICHRIGTSAWWDADPDCTHRLCEYSRFMAQLPMDITNETLH